MRGVMFVMMAGCGHDQSLWKQGDHDGTNNWPEIEVTPHAIDFGDRRYGETVTQTFTVRSVGTENSVLSISDIAFVGGGAFTMLDADRTPNLPTGTEATFTVQFTATDPVQSEDVIEIVSNAKNSAREEVAVRGTGIMPELSISPSTYDYGDRYVGCDVETTFTLMNTGNDVLTVNGVENNGAHFTLYDVPRLPMYLDPGEFSTVRVAFAPEDVGPFTGELVGASDDPEGDRAALERGGGEWPGTYEDQFVIPSDPRVDIVLFVDQSASMDDDRAALTENFADFIERIEHYTSDWQIIVVTNDDGCNNGGIIRPDTPDYALVFENAVFNDASGAYEEAGLIVTTLAAEASDDGECNEGFVRDGALLHVINVSDEPEQSPDPWRTYVDRLVAVKGGAPMYVKMSAVAGDLPEGCLDDDPVEPNTAASGDGYYYAAVATGGAFVSICSNWSNSMRELAAATMIQSTFVLGHEPDPASIVVRLNGEVVEAGWAYDGDANAIVFARGREPVSADEVTVSYTEPYVCW